MQKVVLATGNAGKVRELASLLVILVWISWRKPSWAWIPPRRPA
jgi:inosine/xanthosine triphosphate pyrophosphatase family protein